MNKKLVNLAVAAALAAPAAAMADATMYGKLHMSIDYFDVKQTDAQKLRNEDTFKGWAINKGQLGQGAGRANRIGIKGSEDLGGGLKAIYQVELGIQMAEENNPRGGSPISGGNNITMRNSFVGLAGGWGTFLVGRHDTPLKISTGKLDLFSDTMADYNGTIGFVDLRVDNAIAYISPSFSGFQFAGAVHAGGGATVASGTSIDADSLAEAYSLAIIYKNGPFYGSAAYENINQDILFPYEVNELPDVLDRRNDNAKWRIGLGLLDWNGFTLTGIYEDETAIAGLEDADVQRWQVQAGYAFGNNMVKAMYGSADRDLYRDRNAEEIVRRLADGDKNAWAIAFDHNFSKRTKAYVLYTDVDDAGEVLNQNDWSGFSLGMIHKF